jgi:uncharacterized membrane protein
MAESAHEEITVGAPVGTCFATLVDFTRYPEWIDDLKEVRVVDHDDEGRPSIVEFRAAGMGRSTSYRLRYDYTDAPNRLGWELVEGDIQNAIDGHYRLVADDDDRATKVTYELAIDLILPIPGFVKRRAEDRIIKSALQALKDRVETQR